MISFDFFLCEDKLWFIDAGSGCLFAADINDGSTKLVVQLPVEGFRENYRALYVLNGKVYMPPLFASDFLIYDIRGDALKRIPLQPYFENTVNRLRIDRPNFLDICQYDQYLFCVPMSAGAIIRMNPMTEEIEAYEVPFEKLKRTKPSARPMFRRGCLWDGKIVLAACSANVIVEFDMKSCVGKIIEIKDNVNDGYCGVYCTKQYIVLSSYDNSKLVVFDRNDESTAILPLEGSGMYSYVVGMEDRVIHIRSGWKGKADILDLEGCEIKNITFHTFEETEVINTAKIVNGKLWMLLRKRKSLCVFDLNGNMEREYRMVLSEEDRKQVNRSRVEKILNRLSESRNSIIMETDVENLAVFIRAINQ